MYSGKRSRRDRPLHQAAIASAKGGVWIGLNGIAFVIGRPMGSARQLTSTCKTHIEGHGRRRLLCVHFFNKFWRQFARASVAQKLSRGQRAFSFGQRRRALCGCRETPWAWRRSIV